MGVINVDLAIKNRSQLVKLSVLKIVSALGKIHGLKGTLMQKVISAKHATTVAEVEVVSDHLMNKPALALQGVFLKYSSKQSDPV